MRCKDFLWFSIWVAAALALIGPALWRPQWALANFGDLYAYHYPMRHLVASALQGGRLPFWNPYILCGLPLSANSQAALFYPGTLLSAFFPLALGLTWDYALHLLWGGLGLFLLARRERLSSEGSLFLAVLYVFSPFLIYRITEGIPTLLASLSWVPWCWLAFLARRRGFLAVVWALQLLSGHPQFLIVNALAMGVWSVARKDRGAWLARLAGEGLGALALSALQWAPTAEFVRHSIRRDWPAAFSLGYSVDLRSLLTWVHPNALGNPLDGTWSSVPSVFFECSGVFIGWVGLAAAAAGIVRGKARFGVVLIGLGLFLASGGNNPLYRAAVERGFSWLRTPSRYELLCLWGLVLAAGAGWREMERRFLPRGRVKALLILAASAQLLSWAGPFVRGEPVAPYVTPNRRIVERIAGEPLRVLTDPELANPNKTMLYRAMNVNGYEAFYLRGYPAFAARSEGKPAADSSRVYLGRYDTPEMKSVGVAYSLALDARLIPNPGALPLAYIIDAAGRATGLAVTIPRAERWKVRGRLPVDARALFLSIPNYPGWSARLNGVPVRLEPSGHFLSLPIPYEPGLAHAPLSLEVRFTPSHWAWLLALSTAAWLAWAGRFLAEIYEQAAAVREGLV
jgi:hypothetical protein